MINLLHHVKLPIHHPHLLSGAQGCWRWPQASASACWTTAFGDTSLRLKAALMAISDEKPNSCSVTGDCEDKKYLWRPRLLRYSLIKYEGPLEGGGLFHSSMVWPWANAMPQLLHSQKTQYRRLSHFLSDLLSVYNPSGHPHLSAMGLAVWIFTPSKWILSTKANNICYWNCLLAMNQLIDFHNWMKGELAQLTDDQIKE